MILAPKPIRPGKATFLGSKNEPTTQLVRPLPRRFVPLDLTAPAGHSTAAIIDDLEAKAESYLAHAPIARCSNPLASDRLRPAMALQLQLPQTKAIF